MKELWIYDVIGEGWFEEGVTAAKVRDDLAEFSADEDLLVRINSPGGDVFEAAAIVSLLDEWKGALTVKVDGVAASAASYIATVGERVMMSSGAMLMIHNPWTIVGGEASELRHQADLLDKIAENLAGAYARRSGKKAEEIQGAMDAETWFTPEEAIAFGLADEVDDSKAKAFAIPEELGYKNAPKPEPSPRNRLSVAAMQRRITAARHKLSLTGTTP